MPRLNLAPPRPMAELAAMPLHVVVRDYPETLAVFRRFGLDVPGRGGGSVSEALAGSDTGPLLAELETATAWRKPD